VVWRHHDVITNCQTHTIKATYSGDAGFKPSTGSVVQVVEKFATTTGLTQVLILHNRQVVTFTVTLTARVRHPQVSKVFLMDNRNRNR